MNELTPRIALAHGGGGQLTQRLLEDVVFKRLGGNARGMDDSATLDFSGGRLAFTTDSFVVQPLSFPGGDIGRLAVCGTINDLACAGAEPIAVSLSLIIEEGLPVESLARYVESAAAAAEEAGVAIVTGDTKVIERRGGDGLFINTAGVGRVLTDPAPGLSRARAGDVILINGPIAEHGVAVMSARGEYGIAAPVRSDVAPLGGLAAALLRAVPETRCLKDPTRGGVAMALHDIAHASGVALAVEETSVPVSPSVRAFCDLLGLDPMEVANEGKLLVICPAGEETRALEAMRGHPLGRGAVRLGDARASDRPMVVLKTRLGGERIVGVPSGENLPRIC